MLLATLVAALQVAVIQPSTPPPAPAAPGAERQTTRVCTYEARTGQISRRRVCRDVARGAQSDETRQFMRDNQRTREPDRG